MSAAPFDLEQQLYDRLYIKKHVTLERSIIKRYKAEKNYPGELQNLNSNKLKRLFQINPALPGHPHLLLSKTEELKRQLADEFTTETLDKLSWYFWLIAKPDSSHISSLTHQVVRGRTPTVTENGWLHLLWYHDCVFIKPLPKYLLSHAFWEFYFSDTASSPLGSRTQEIREAAKGFLRTYVFLIQHKSDFTLAQTMEPPLLPKSLKYGAFMRFLDNCRSNISDDDVSLRYHYGDLRLSRINFWIQIFQMKTRYFNVDSDYSQYFSRYFAVILFIFGVLSVILSAMQVAISVPGKSPSWDRFEGVSRWFAIVVLVFVTIISAFLVGKFLVMGLRETIYAASKQFQPKNRGRKGKKGNV